MNTLKFLGIGSAFNTKLGNTSAYIKATDSLLLIDCGEDVFKKILELNLLDNINNINILITHLHSDHAGSLGSLIFYCSLILKKKANIYYPHMENLEKLLLLQGVSKEHYNVIPNKQLEELNLTFEEVSTYHVDIFKDSSDNVYYGEKKNISDIRIFDCFGYRIKHNNNSIYYSGDSHHITSEDIELLEKAGYDELYQDTCGLDYPGNAHLSLNLLCTLIKPQYRNKVYCMHIDKAFDVNEAKTLGFNIAEVTEDGK